MIFRWGSMARMRQLAAECAVTAVLLTGAAAGAADLVYAVDFSSPEIQAAVKACPQAKVTKDFEGTDVLTVTVPKGKIPGDKMVIVAIPLKVSALKLAGSSLFSEMDLKYSNVTQPAHPWNGVKAMLVYEAGGKTEYPDINPGWQKNVGTRDWYRANCVTEFPKDTVKVTLMLGLQESSGEVSFRNIRFYRGASAPVSTLAQEKIPQAKYTKDFPTGRGVMSPNRLQDGDFEELARWNVNLIRWQLNRSLAKEYTLDEYKAYTAQKLDELDRVLPIAAKNGVKVVVDLHPFEGGKLILSTPEGRAYLLEIWREIARRYKGNPAIWGYDILNEPHSRNLRPGDPSWPEIAAGVIAAIREIDPEVPIIVESDKMAHVEGLEFLPVFDSPNIIYSIHMYHPGNLTHQLDATKGPFLGYPDSERGWNKEMLRSTLAKAREFQLKTGARIYVGEFSCIRWAPGAADYIRDLIDLFEEYGWDWSYHAFREWQGWSVEHSDDPTVSEPVPTTRRKEVLLKAFEKNRR